MISKNKIMVLLGFLVFLNGAMAQNNASANTDETSIKSRALMLQATSTDRAMRLNLIFQFESGSVTVDADSIKALAFLAGDGTLNRTTGLVSGSNNSDIRIRAVILLGQQNSDEAKTAIKRALSFEVDSFAMTSAFAALAKMGANDTQTIRTMNSAMRRDIATLRNNGTALAYIEAISQLVTASNPDIEAFETISLLSEGAGYNAEVRQRAMNYLKTLWS